MEAQPIETPALSSETVEEATRLRILTEASRLFSTRGYRGTSTRDIAREVGIRQPSLFHHFAAKRLIMDELLSLSLDRAVVFAEAVAKQPGTPAARLTRILRADLRYVTSVSYDLSGTASEEVLTDPDFRHQLIKRRRLHKVWRNLVKEGIKADEFFPYPYSMVQQLLEGIFKELICTSARHAAGAAPHPDEVARFVIRALLMTPSDLDDVIAEADRLEMIDELRY